MNVIQKWLLATIVVLAVAGQAQAALRIPLVDPEPVKVSSLRGSPISAAQVRAAIIAGAATHQWTLKSEDPSKVVLKLEKGKYYVELNVPYTSEGYRIEYVRSVNLNDGVDENDSHPNVYPEIGKELSKPVRTIHSGYGRWLRNLTGAINTALLASPGEQ